MLQKHIEEVMDIRQKQTQTSWYDSGVRDVKGEGYYQGLLKAQRLVNKQKKLDKE